MMAILAWPNWDNQSVTFYYTALTLPISRFSEPNTRAIKRIGPHNIDVLSIIVCGMLGDWWGHSIKGLILPSVRFQIEQAKSNISYIYYLTELLNKLGYCASDTPKKVGKAEGKKFKDPRTNPEVVRYNYRLTLFTFTNLFWIYTGFYHSVEGALIKRVPTWISYYITPIGLAHWIMQDGSRQSGQGIFLATNSFSYNDCLFLSNILNQKFGLTVTVIKTGVEDQWRLNVWKRSMPLLAELVGPYIIPEMRYKLEGYL